MLAVSDSGVGMSAETRNQIFEPFFSTKGTGHGSGLGLATVYGIVKQSGGHISVNSELGHGSTFRVYFPIRPHAPAPEPAQPSSEIARGSETILLVEDDSRVRKLVRKVLLSNGYTVLAAEGAAEGLRRVEEHAGPIHLLITDVITPDMNGKQLASRLAERHPELLVLFISGYMAAVTRSGLQLADMRQLGRGIATSRTRGAMPR